MHSYLAQSTPVFFVRHTGPIGAGGLGVVDEVTVVQTYAGGPKLGHVFARKKLGPQWAADLTQAARFEREIEQMKVMDHPNIVPFRGENIDNDRFYLMPRYPQSLRSYLIAHPGPTDARGALSLCIKVADALEYAHRCGFVHRDLKPENILLDQNLEPYIADWGLGRFIHQHSKVLDLTKAGLGTAYYCSVEQWANGEGTARSDVYSLGMMIAELLLGGRGSLVQPGLGVQRDVLAPSTQLGAHANAVVRKMTAILAAQRHADMGEVAATLRWLLTM